MPVFIFDNKPLAEARAANGPFTRSELEANYYMKTIEDQKTIIEDKKSIIEDKNIEIDKLRAIIKLIRRTGLNGN
tara:strand:- start:2291 stop:2515 length:225 start_codon:yes stop_codon:yes gene_type:complete